MIHLAVCSVLQWTAVTGCENHVYSKSVYVRLEGSAVTFAVFEDDAQKQHRAE